MTIEFTGDFNEVSQLQIFCLSAFLISAHPLTSSHKQYQWWDSKVGYLVEITMDLWVCQSVEGYLQPYSINPLIPNVTILHWFGSLKKNI